LDPQLHANAYCNDRTFPDRNPDSDSGPFVHRDEHFANTQPPATVLNPVHHAHFNLDSHLPAVRQSYQHPDLDPLAHGDQDFCSPDTDRDEIAAAAQPDNCRMQSGL
jgi:hypothetical protein